MHIYISFLVSLVNNCHVQNTNTLMTVQNPSILYDEAKITNNKLTPFYANTNAVNGNAVNVQTLQQERATRESTYDNPNVTLKTVQTGEMLYEETIPLKPKSKGCGKQFYYTEADIPVTNVSIDAAVE